MRDVDANAREALAAAADEAGAELRETAGDEADLVLELPDGRTLRVELKAASAPTPAFVRALPIGSRPDGIRVLVADRLFEPARRAATEVGWSWLDGRGHLRLVGPGLYIDTDVAPVGMLTASSAKEVIAGRSGIAVALALLMRSADPPGVREVARWSDLSPSAISQMRRRLDEASLLDRNGLPLVPELFWELVDVWESAVVRVPVGRLPGPDDDDSHLELGRGDPSGPGWAVAGATAAVAWGAPVVQGGTATIDYYVPSAAALRHGRRVLGEPTHETGPPARLATAPSRLVVAPRFDVPTPSPGLPLAHPVVAALDLALDPSRGREALEEWTPPKGYVRVW